MRFVSVGGKKAANRRTVAESTKDDDMDSSEVCTPLQFFFFVSDVLSRYAFSWHSSLAKYVTRMTGVRRCSSVIIVTAVRFRFCFCLLHLTDHVFFQGFICSA
jgi:hypothetical protein